MGLFVGLFKLGLFELFDLGLHGLLEFEGMFSSHDILKLSFKLRNDSGFEPMETVSLFLVQSNHEFVRISLSDISGEPSMDSSFKASLNSGRRLSLVLSNSEEHISV